MSILIAHTPAHTRPAGDVASELGVDPTVGLGTGEAAARLAADGPNMLAEAARRPALLRFADQFRDILILILLGAAVVSFVVSGEVKTPAVVLAVVLLNAVIGFVQEQKAEASLEALKKMLASSTRVRRDGGTVSVPTQDVVADDVVLTSRRRIKQ
ncbi:MAG: cation-transporting P-type ATPase [Actinomycetota bacterium]